MKSKLLSKVNIKKGNGNMSGNTSIMEPSADLKHLDESSKVDYKEGEATLFD